MHIFKDRTGREWSVDITVLTVERVKAACNIDLPDLVADRMQALDSLLANPLKLVAVIFECCRSAAESNGLGLDALKEVFNGETADAAIEAWLEELIGFFPDARRRAALKKAIQGLRDLGTKVMELGAATITDAEIEATAARTLEAVRKHLEHGSGVSSGNMPAISALIPDH